MCTRAGEGPASGENDGPALISRRAFVALEHRNFRLIWLGLLFSFTGSFMQNAGLLWHVSLLV